MLVPFQCKISVWLPGGVESTPTAQASVAEVALTPCRTPGNVEPGGQHGDEEQPPTARTPVASVATRLVRKTRITAPV